MPSILYYIYSIQIYRIFFCLQHSTSPLIFFRLVRNVIPIFWFTNCFIFLFDVCLPHSFLQMSCLSLYLCFGGFIDCVYCIRLLVVVVVYTFQDSSRLTKEEEEKKRKKNLICIVRFRELFWYYYYRLTFWASIPLLLVNLFNTLYLLSHFFHAALIVVGCVCVPFGPEIHFKLLNDTKK